MLVLDENVDALIALLVEAAPTQIRETALGLAELSKRTDKTIIACFMGKDHVKEGVNILIENSMPNYYFPERAVASLAAMVRYHKYLISPEKIYKKFDIDKEKVKKIFEKAISEGKRYLSDEKAREVIEVYGIRIPKTKLVKDINEADEIAEEIGYPLVLKISSPDILHKTDIGGVKLGIKNEKELRENFEDIMREAKRYMPNARMLGVILQEFIDAKREVILGMNKDPQFGPLLMFGLGGIYVEVLKDVSFRVAPITDSEAWEMISEIKSYPILKGVRGEKPADINSIVNALLRLSQLVTDFPNILEMDINPLMVYDKGKGSVATDVRISLGG
ncbi:Peptidyl-lysine N-acetyltransferase Pat [subsurface metagenome]